MIISYPQMLKERARIHPQRPAYIFEGNIFSYETYWSQASQTAAYLLSLGLKKGDRIGILDLNNSSVINLITGSFIAGIIPVSFNWKSLPAELDYMAEDAGIKHLFYGLPFRSLVKASSYCENISLYETENLLSASSQIQIPSTFESCGDDDACIILYTSGTAGNPKGVMLSYRNLYTCYYLCASDTPGFVPDARNLVCGPLYSIFGLGAFVSCIYAGATNVLIRMFEPAFVLKIMVGEKVTNALLVPIMMRLMFMVEGVDLMDFSSLTHIQYGGSPMQPDLLMMAKKIFNCHFTQVYGLTETAGVASALRFDDHDTIISSGNKHHPLLFSAGKPGLSVSLKIMNENKEEVTANNTGEVWIKGNNLSLGYWNKKELNENVFDKDGWMHTGDIGYMDENGFLFLVDRLNDKIVVKGVNIFPAEIEKVVEYYPGFREAAVIGVPDDKSGEAISVMAVAKDNNQSTLEELQQWCEGKLPLHKIPKHLHYIKELPRNQTGKVLRRILREPFWQHEKRNIKG